MVNSKCKFQMAKSTMKCFVARIKNPTCKLKRKIPRKEKTQICQEKFESQRFAVPCFKLQKPREVLFQENNVCSVSMNKLYTMSNFTFYNFLFMGELSPNPNCHLLLLLICSELKFLLQFAIAFFQK